MTRNEAVLEQIRTLAAELSPEERLSAIRTIAEAAPVASEPVAEKDELVHRLWAEQEAWFAQPLSLREKHRGQFIAVQNGSVIDRDPDKRTLHLRVRREHPGAPIPILDGNWDQVPDLVIRSPRLERIPD